MSAQDATSHDASPRAPRNAVEPRDEPGGGAALADKQVFTTGEAARICNVSQQTIIRCFDRGRLQGFRVPGSRFRRIPRTELLRFMRENEIPLERLEAGRTRVLIVGDAGAAGRALAADARFDARIATDAFDAGMLAGVFRPHVALFAGVPDGLDPARALRTLRENSPAPPRIVTLGEAPAGLNGGVFATIDRAHADNLAQRLVDALARGA